MHWYDLRENHTKPKSGMSTFNRRERYVRSKTPLCPFLIWLLISLGLAGPRRAGQTQ